MKYVSMHYDDFQYPAFAFMFAFMQFSAVCIVEVVNIINLININGIDEIIMNYVALGVICEFDDYFLEIYKHQKIRVFIGAQLEFKNFAKGKYEVIFDDQAEIVPREDVENEEAEGMYTKVVATANQIQDEP